MDSILNYVDFSEAEHLTENDNIVCCTLLKYGQSYNKLSLHISGILEFIKLKTNYKMVIFYDESISNDIINLVKVSEKVIVCKYSVPFAEGLFGLIIRYIPMFTDVIKFNKAYICNPNKNYVQWKQSLDILDSEYNMYYIPLAAELLVRNVISRNLVDIKTWHRITGSPIIIKNGNQLPIEILNRFLFETIYTPEYQTVIENMLIHENDKVSNKQGKFIYGCDEIFLLSVMKYIEDNKIPFSYKVAGHTHRSPFYYWLEEIKPSEEKRKEFLKIVKSNDNSIEEFLNKYPGQKRYELHKLIQKSFNNDYSFFESDIIASCIKRFNNYSTKNNNIIYLKYWD